MLLSQEAAEEWAHVLRADYFVEHGHFPPEPFDHGALIGLALLFFVSLAVARRG